MLEHLTRVFLHIKAGVLSTQEWLHTTAHREEGQIAEYLRMGIVILIVIAIAAVLWQFGGAIMDVINDAIGELGR